MYSTSYTDRLTGPQREYAELARQHYEHDLTTSDRDLVERAGKKIGIYSTIGASVGLGLGLFLSLRIRRTGQIIYNAAKKAERPTALQFKDGHTVPFPNVDTSELFRPSPFGQLIMATLFSISGFFIGGELGLLTGSVSAKKLVSKDPAARNRIENAFRAYRIDLLRKEAADLERRTSSSLPSATPVGNSLTRQPQGKLV